MDGDHVPVPKDVVGPDSPKARSSHEELAVMLSEIIRDSCLRFCKIFDRDLEIYRSRFILHYEMTMLSFVTFIRCQHNDAVTILRTVLPEFIGMAARRVTWVFGSVRVHEERYRRFSTIFQQHIDVLLGDYALLASQVSILREATWQKIQPSLPPVPELNFVQIMYNLTVLNFPKLFDLA